MNYLQQIEPAGLLSDGLTVVCEFRHVGCSPPHPLAGRGLAGLNGGSAQLLQTGLVVVRGDAVVEEAATEGEGQVKAD